MLKSNQWVLLTHPRPNFHCMHVHTEDEKTGYVIDYQEGIATIITNDHVNVVYEPQKERWVETTRYARF